jgi:hypothetical protein
VHSEPAAIDGVLRARLAGVPDETICEWLRWVVGALGRPSPGESAYVVKLDCWSTIDLGLFERAFPTTPWVFVYREPEEVLASHLRRPGPQVLPGVLPPQLVGVDAGSLAEITLEEYAGRVLKRIGDAALEHASSPCALLVEYADLPAAVVNHIAPHFGIEFDEAALAAVAVASTRDAKNPVLPFEPDSAAKRRELTESGRTIAQNLLRGVYDRLEAARMEALAC